MMPTMLLYSLLTVILYIVYSSIALEDDEMHVLWIRDIESRYREWIKKTDWFHNKLSNIGNLVGRDPKVSEDGKKQMEKIWTNFGNKILSHPEYKEILENGAYHFECMSFLFDVFMSK